MIERYNLFLHEFSQATSKELQLFSIIAQSFFQPFSLQDNLLVILTALTAGPGVGFNRAMLFLTDGDKLKGEFWLGPASVEEAESIWRVLSTPGIGYAEIIEHNRSRLSSEADTLTKKLKKISYPIHQEGALIPALATASREPILVKDAWNEPLVDRQFLELIRVDDFLYIPLLAQKEALGAIILDNAITKIPIRNRDIELASICGLIAGNHIYTARLQRRLVDMKKMAAMGEMAMFVTHQLRNPLVTIGGFADQLLDPRTPPRKRKRNVQIIRGGIRRLERILLRLTQFIKADIRERVPVDVEELLKLAVEAANPRILAEKVTLKTEIEPGLGTVLCDPTHAGEAIRNVVDNALDALNGQGRIYLRAYRESDEWAVISVEDTGRGIPEPVRSKIFDTFVSTKEEGMGLGLAYVKRVMEACGGRIDFESTEGKGTTFRLHFRTKP
ncbi:MAG: HAMP domain-containing sensor histidine kinase [Acidobacteriota bacterium]